MTHRGPFQPLPFCDSVIPFLLPMAAEETESECFHQLLDPQRKTVILTKQSPNEIKK